MNVSALKHTLAVNGPKELEGKYIEFDANIRTGAMPEGMKCPLKWHHWKVFVKIGTYNISVITKHLSGILSCEKIPHNFGDLDRQTGSKDEISQNLNPWQFQCFHYSQKIVVLS